MKNGKTTLWGVEGLWGVSVSNDSAWARTTCTNMDESQRQISLKNQLHAPHKKINSKWTKDLNIRPETIKFLEENRGNLHDIGFVKDFLDMTTKTQATKAKIDKWDYVKLKNFCASKETIEWKGNQPIE